MDERRKYLNYLGWLGGVVCLIGYGLNTRQLVGSDSLVFLLGNTFGCSCLICYSFRKKAFANTAISSVYLLLTLLALGSRLWH